MKHDTLFKYKATNILLGSLCIKHFIQFYYTILLQHKRKFIVDNTKVLCAFHYYPLSILFFCYTYATWSLWSSM